MNAVAVEYSQSDIDKAVKFMARMMSFQAQGMTFEQAGEAVLLRDTELFDVISGRVSKVSEEGQMIRHELAAQVYNEIRK